MCDIVLNVWQQIHESRQIHFREEDTYDGYQDDMIQEDDDMQIDKKLLKSNKTFGSTGLSNYGARYTSMTGDSDLNQLLENRKEQMSYEIRNARRPIIKSPEPELEMEEEDDNLDYDADIAATFKFNKDSPINQSTKAIELKALDGADDFDGMDEAGGLKRDTLEKPIKPLLIPMAKNRVKLQPMPMKPLA